MTNDQADNVIHKHIGKISNLGEGHPVEKLNFYRDLVKEGFQMGVESQRESQRNWLLQQQGED